MKDSNPFELKVLKEQPKEYLDTDEFINFLKKKNITVRKDNLQGLLTDIISKCPKRKERVLLGQSQQSIKFPIK